MTYVDQKMIVKQSLYKNAKKSVIISINSKTSKSLTILSNQYKFTKYSKLKWLFQHILGPVEFIIFFFIVMPYSAKIFPLVVYFFYNLSTNFLRFFETQICVGYKKKKKNMNYHYLTSCSIIFAEC